MPRTIRTILRSRKNIAATSSLLHDDVHDGKVSSDHNSDYNHLYNNEIERDRGGLSTTTTTTMTNTAAAAETTTTTTTGATNGTVSSQTADLTIQVTEKDHDDNGTGLLHIVSSSTSIASITGLTRNRANSSSSSSLKYAHSSHPNSSNNSTSNAINNIDLKNETVGRSSSYHHRQTNTRLRTSMPHLQQKEQQLFLQQHQQQLNNKRKISAPTKNTTPRRTILSMLSGNDNGTGNSSVDSFFSSSTAASSPTQLSSSLNQHNSPKGTRTSFSLLYTSSSLILSTWTMKLVPYLPKLLRVVLFLVLFNFGWLVFYSPTPTSHIDVDNKHFNSIDPLRQQQQQTQERYLRSDGKKSHFVRNAFDSNENSDRNSNTNQVDALTDSLNHFDHHHLLEDHVDKSSSSKIATESVLEKNLHDHRNDFDEFDKNNFDSNNNEIKYKIKLTIDETISKFDTFHERQGMVGEELGNSDTSGSRHVENNGTGVVDPVVTNNVNRLITTTSVPIIEDPSIAALQRLHEEQQQQQQVDEGRGKFNNDRYEDDRRMDRGPIALFNVTKSSKVTANRYESSDNYVSQSGNLYNKKKDALPYMGNRFDTRDERNAADEDTGRQVVIPLPEVNKGTSHRLDDGDDNVLLVIISNRVDGIIPTIASILHHCTSTLVDVVLIGEHRVNEKVHYHFGKRIHQFISLTVDDVQDDLQRNGIDPIWTWPEWHSSIKDKNWKNENTIHVASWDNLPTHAHELNHLRFYLPYVSIFRNKGYFYFLDDDVLVHKDLGPVAGSVMKAIPRSKGLVTACNIWLWDSNCHHFTFHDQNDTILNMPSLYGDRKRCSNVAEEHCFPDSYINFVQSVLPPNGMLQTAWNFGFSLFALENWRDLHLTDRYEKVMKRSYELHVFPETSLTFGLGTSYLAFAGAVECWDEKHIVVRDGFGFIDWNRYETTFGGSHFYDKIDVAHYTGPEKPWVANTTIDVNSLQPWLDVMAKERLRIPDQLPNRPSKNLFTVLASDRTGVHWVMHTLDSHPHVCASGEAEKPETGFSSDVLLPSGLPWYPSCSIIRGCTYSFIEEAITELTKDTITTTRMRQIPRRCADGYDARATGDPYLEHLERLCNFVQRLDGNLTRAALGRLWIEAFVNEDKSLVGCSCPRGTYAKGIKVEPEWLTYENFPDEEIGPPQLVLDDSLIHGSKFIRLKRKNLWARYKSMLIARLSGQYHLQSPEARKMEEQNIEMITVSIEDMEWQINYMIMIDQFGDQWAMKHASEVLWIEYEECRSNTQSCFKQMFEFLQVDPDYVDVNRQKFESAFADIHLDESLDRIKNANIVSEALAVNGWGHFIGLDGSYTEIQLLIYDNTATLAKTRPIKGINSTMYGHDPNAEGYGCRFTAAVPLLRSLQPSTLVVLSDDRDLLINYPSGSDSFKYSAISEFRKAFYELTRKNRNAIIISAESDCCASALTHSSPGDYFDSYGRRIKRACSSGMPDCSWAGNDKAHAWQQFMKKLAVQRLGTAPDNMFLDAGLVVGQAQDLLKVITDLQIQRTEDDRAVLTDFMYRFPDRILLDYGMRLFGLSHGKPRSSSYVDQCLLADEQRPPLASRLLNPLNSFSTALFIHSPREVGCHPFENSRIQRFPSWGKEGIQLRPTLEHFNRILLGQETVVLPPSYGRKLENIEWPEIPYVVDENGVFVSDVIRNKTDDGSFQLRVRPTEALYKLAYKILKRVRAPDERYRWRRLLQYVDSSVGFPYWAWYGDFNSCNKNNYNLDSIPVLTTAARMDCDYAFPIPNYMTIIDTQRSSLHWHGMFRQFEKKYPWANKIPKVVWRGSLSEAEWKDVYTNVRWRLCKTVMDLRSSSSSSSSNLYDVGLTSIPKRISDKVFVNALEVGGFAKKITPMRDFMNYKAILDMDGISWSSRFGSLLCFNSVVIKVEPTYAEYFFTSLVPWTHYIPVKNDLSDLHENVQWALDPANEDIIQSIISSANQFCAERLTPANIAHDLLDIWEAYVEMLDTADPSWSKKWKILRKELFATNSIAKMVAI